MSSQKEKDENKRFRRPPFKSFLPGQKYFKMHSFWRYFLIFHAGSFILFVFLFASSFLPIGRSLFQMISFDGTYSDEAVREKYVFPYLSMTKTSNSSVIKQ